MASHQAERLALTVSSNSTQETPNDRVIDFLKFEPELRNKIYGIMCVKSFYIGSNRDTSSRGFFKDAAKWRNLAFATSCRQIYEEMCNVFYAQSGFEFSSVRPFLEFLEGIGRRTLTKLRFVNTTTGMPFIGLRYLKFCDNLQQLETYVEGWIADYCNRVSTKMPVPWTVLLPFEAASCILSWRLERDRVRYT